MLREFEGIARQIRFLLEAGVPSFGFEKDKLVIDGGGGDDGISPAVLVSSFVLFGIKDRRE